MKSGRWTDDTGRVPKARGYDNGTSQQIKLEPRGWTVAATCIIPQHHTEVSSGRIGDHPPDWRPIGFQAPRSGLPKDIILPYEMVIVPVEYSMLA